MTDGKDLRAMMFDAMKSADLVDFWRALNGLELALRQAGRDPLPSQYANDPYFVKQRSDFAASASQRCMDEARKLVFSAKKAGLLDEDDRDRWPDR